MIEATLADALRAAARARPVIIASDYDGTLSPIVDDPAAAVPYAPALDALVRLSAVTGVHAVVISGRSVEALAKLTGAPDGVTLIGTHGAETSAGTVDSESVAVVRDVIDALEDVAGTYAGTMLEPKPTGAALHYRHAVEPEAAASAARGVGRQFDVRIIDGKKVVELVVGHGNKGMAIDALRAQWSADCVVFFGDDTTDEDVFAMLREGDVGVKVGDGTTLATHRVADPAAVGAALEIMLAGR